MSPIEIEQVVVNLIRNGIESRPSESQVTVRTELESDSARVYVSDNGSGFVVDPDHHADEGHFGILGMHERLRRLGGSLQIESHPGDGTIVEGRVPITGAT